MDIRSRTAFPLFVVGDAVTLDNKPAERDSHFSGTAPEWQNILGKNTIFFDIENLPREMREGRVRLRRRSDDAEEPVHARQLTA